MATIDLYLCREIQEDDMITEPFQNNQPDNSAMAADAFKVFLSSLHANGQGGKDGFVMRGYAALWALDKAAFQGKTQKQLATELGVSHVNFNRALNKWARGFGFVSNAMRPRQATHAANAARRRAVKP